MFHGTSNLQVKWYFRVRHLSLRHLFSLRGSEHWTECNYFSPSSHCIFLLLLLDFYYSKNPPGEVLLTLTMMAAFNHAK